jgi:hypothetical protein
MILSCSLYDMIIIVLQEDTELLSKRNLNAHSSIAVRLRRAEKNILMSVAQYAANQKSTAAERAATATQDRCDSRVRVQNVPAATGEEEFVRVDGVRVYGSMEERAALETEFRNSVLRGDYRNFSKTSTGELGNEGVNQQVSSVSETEVESSQLESMKIEETSLEAEGGPVTSAEASVDINAKQSDGDCCNVSAVCSEVHV